MADSLITLRNAALTAEIDLQKQTLTILDSVTGYRLFLADALCLTAPAVDGEAPGYAFEGAVCAGESAELRFTSAKVDYTLTIDLSKGDIRLAPRMTRCAARELNALYILPAGSGLNFFDLVNFRNRHGSSFTWPELNLADAVNTTTFSNDWQFAPHPSLFMFRRDAITLLCAPVDMHRAFGYEYASKRYRLEKWILNYGEAGHGLPLDGGCELPAFTFMRRAGGTVYDALDDYCRLLVREGKIADPKGKPAFPWHRANLYCTWCDQSALMELKRGGEPLPIELDAQTNVVAHPSKLLTAAMIRRAAGIIRREGLPFTTFMIDDGWQRALGDWRADEERLGDFRGLIDELHAMGFKVILWINFADIVPEAHVEERFLVPGYVNRHGKRVWNYSDETVRREYLEPLIRRLVSDEPGCYNADGIKTDFLADKVHPDTPCALEWRGEENYFMHLFRFVMETMRRYKKDACHLGAAGHPFLAEYMDIIRTYDFVSTNLNEQRERALMVTHSSCGAPVALDFHGCNENYHEYFALAKELDCSVEIGKIMYMKRDIFAPLEEADEAFYDFLRRELTDTQARLDGEARA